MCIVWYVGQVFVVVAADIHRLISQARHFDGTIVAAAQVGDFISTGSAALPSYGGLPCRQTTTSFERRWPSVSNEQLTITRPSHFV